MTSSGGRTDLVYLLSSSCAFGGRLVVDETKTDLATLCSSTGLATGALNRSFMSAKTANFLQDALHLELGLEALQSAVNGLSFANGNFWHGLLWV